METLFFPFGRGAGGWKICTCLSLVIYCLAGGGVRPCYIVDSFPRRSFLNKFPLALLVYASLNARVNLGLINFVEVGYHFALHE